MNEVLLQHLCESSLGTAIAGRYVEPRSAQAIAYSVEKQKILFRLKCYKTSYNLFSSETYYLKIHRMFENRSSNILCLEFLQCFE